MISKDEVKLRKCFRTVGILFIMTVIVFIGTILIGVDFILKKLFT